jgi:NAD(P)-dependent dehydrogenase (short-subunit alcohol dehydrogenase family)
VQQDLRDPGGPQRLAEQLRHMGYAQLDAIILNAGINRPGPLSGMSISDFDDLFAVNVRAPYFLVQQLLSLTHPGASIVFISSLAAKAAIGRLSAYAATKGALDTIVKHLAVELGETGIRVNGLAPGVVQTESSSITQSESGRDATLELQAFKRLAIPEDIAKVAAFLASDEARWITGQIVHVDGGSKL